MRRIAAAWAFTPALVFASVALGAAGNPGEGGFVWHALPGPRAPSADRPLVPQGLGGLNADKSIGIFQRTRMIRSLPGTICSIVGKNPSWYPAKR